VLTGGMSSKVLDLIGTMLWTGMLAGLGYAPGTTPSRSVNQSIPVAEDGTIRSSIIAG